MEALGEDWEEQRYSHEEFTDRSKKEIAEKGRRDVDSSLKDEKECTDTREKAAEFTNDIGDRVVENHGRCDHKLVLRYVIADYMFGGRDEHILFPHIYDQTRFVSDLLAVKVRVEKYEYTKKEIEAYQKDLVGICSVVVYAIFFLAALS